MNLPPIVAETVARYLDRLDEADPSLLSGLYLVGSVALGDYREGRSDIDFVATAARPWGDEHLPLLRDCHGSLQIEGRPSFDGIYIDADALARWPATPAVVPFSRDGSLERRTCFEANPAVWLCLAQCGLAIRGPATGALRIAEDPQRLRLFLIGNLRGYWTNWVGQCRDVLARRDRAEGAAAVACEWGVLGTARIACTMATHRIVSKTEAGHWALDTFEREWRPPIHDALAARNGTMSRVPIERFEQVLRFAEMIVARASA